MRWRTQLCSLLAAHGGPGVALVVAHLHVEPDVALALGLLGFLSHSVDERTAVRVLEAGLASEAPSTRLRAVRTCSVVSPRCRAQIAGRALVDEPDVLLVAALVDLLNA